MLWQAINLIALGAFAGLVTVYAARRERRLMNRLRGEIRSVRDEIDTELKSCRRELQSLLERRGRPAIVKPPVALMNELLNSRQPALSMKSQARGDSDISSALRLRSAEVELLLKLRDKPTRG